MKDSIKKIIIFLIILIAAVTVVLYFFPQLWLVPMLKLRFSPYKNPSVYALPISREVIASTVDLTGFDSVSYFGINFRSPWRNMREKNLSSNSVLLEFGNGNTVFLFSNKDQPTMLEALLGDDPKNAEQIRSMFGQEAIKTNYALQKLMLNTTPDDISIYQSRKEVVAKSILLILKPIAVPWPTQVEPKIYNFITARKIKGFQYGDPWDGKVIIDFYNENDESGSMLINGSEITQNDIDFILATLEVSYQQLAKTAIITDKIEYLPTEEMRVTIQNPSESAIKICSPSACSLPGGFHMLIEKYETDAWVEGMGACPIVSKKVEMPITGADFSCLSLPGKTTLELMTGLAGSQTGRYRVAFYLSKDNSNPIYSDEFSIERAGVFDPKHKFDCVIDEDCAIRRVRCWQCDSVYSCTNKTWVDCNLTPPAGGCLPSAPGSVWPKDPTWPASCKCVNSKCVSDKCIGGDCLGA